jgi:uncharacterized surface protein with fasciclin (FAS1) repeats
LVHIAGASTFCLISFLRQTTYRFEAKMRRSACIRSAYSTRKYRDALERNTPKEEVENAMNSQDHTTLVAAVKAAGLVETLEGPGPYTVFAPTNEACAKLPAGTVDALLKPENKATLTKSLPTMSSPEKLRRKICKR